MAKTQKRFGSSVGTKLGSSPGTAADAPPQVTAEELAIAIRLRAEALRKAWTELVVFAEGRPASRREPLPERAGLLGMLLDIASTLELSAAMASRLRGLLVAGGEVAAPGLPPGATGCVVRD